MIEEIGMKIGINDENNVYIAFSKPVFDFSLSPIKAAEMATQLVALAKVANDLAVAEKGPQLILPNSLN